METFQLTIQTPKTEVFSGDAQKVHLRTETGEAELYKGHTSFMGSISFSAATVTTDKGDESYLLRQGFVFSDPAENKVRILAYSADKKAQMNRTTAEEYMKMIQDSLDANEDLTKYQIQFLEEQKIAVGDLIESLDHNDK